MAKSYKFPKSMGLCADRLYTLRAKRLAEQKKVEELEAEENALKAWIIDNLPRSQMTGASGQIANVRVLPNIKPQLVDADKFYGYIKKTGRFDLLQKRLSEGAVMEILEAKKGAKIPGIDTFDAKKISLTKVN